VQPLYPCTATGDSTLHLSIDAGVTPDDAAAATWAADSASAAVRRGAGRAAVVGGDASGSSSEGHRDKRRRVDGDGSTAAAAGLPQQQAVRPSCAPATVTALLWRGSVFIKGRYCKYARDLSQTPWVVDKGTVRLGNDTSVEEIIGEVAARHCAAVWAPGQLAGDGDDAAAVQPRFKFHAAGREDVDVRMLGSGRPFILELLDARPALCPLWLYPVLARDINAAAAGVLSVRDVVPATRAEFAALDAGARGKRKHYTAVVWCSQPQTPASLAAALDARGATRVQQVTPLRVLHRRTLMTRTKWVYAFRTEWLNPWYFLLHLTTSAGAYVKELVHGDMGRTRPNVGELLGGGCEADILQLDVTGMVYGAGAGGAAGEGEDDEEEEEEDDE
jgi:tRNA pseudouridine synthase 10